MLDQPTPEELPVGLMMRMAQDPCAMEHFFQMSHERQQGMLDHIRASQTGDEAKSRIEASLEFLDADEPFSHRDR